MTVYMCKGVVYYSDGLFIGTSAVFKLKNINGIITKEGMLRARAASDSYNQALFDEFTSHYRREGFLFCKDISKNINNCQVIC